MHEGAEAGAEAIVSSPEDGKVDGLVIKVAESTDIGTIDEIGGMMPESIEEVLIRLDTTELELVDLPTKLALAE